MLASYLSRSTGINSCIIQLRPESLVVPGEREPVPDIRLAQPLDRLAQVLLRDLYLLDPALEVLVRGQLQHGQGLLAASQVAGTDQDTVEGEVLRPHFLSGLLGHADADEVSVHIHHREVLGEVEVLGRVGGVDDQVEGHDVRGSPVLVGRGDEAVGA